MLSTLRLENFQSWEVLDLPLSPVVVIVGETDQGKSAILRALSAVLFNALEGHAFVRHGATVASIELRTETSVVVLQRGSGTNRYIVDGKAFDKIARSVPDGVQQALEISEVSLGEDVLRLQFQGQTEAPFLLADQGTRATRLLGSVSKVASLYAAARTTKQKSKAALAAVQAHEGILEDTKKRLDGFSYLDSAVPLVTQLQAVLDNLEQYRTANVKLRACATELSRLHNRETVLSRSEHLLVLKVNYLHFVEARLRQHAAVSVAASALHAAVSQDRLVTSKISQLNLVRSVLGSKERYLARKDEILAVRSKVVAFRSLLSRDTALNSAETQALSRLNQVRTLHDDLVREFTCPTCGREKAA